MFEPRGPGIALARAADGPWNFRDPPRVTQRRVNGLEVGLGPGRFAVMAWTSTPIGVELDSGRSGRGGRVKVATRSPGGARFRPPRAISGRKARAPMLATSDTGEAIVAWSNRRDRVQASIKPSGDRFQRPLTLSPPARGTPFLSVGPDGTAVAAWTAGVGGIDASKRPFVRRGEASVRSRRLGRMTSAST